MIVLPGILSKEYNADLQPCDECWSRNNVIAASKDQSDGQAISQNYDKSHNAGKTK
jgi:hypothetical protein